MGTDRYEVHRSPCLCGHGTFVVEECTPDHPYPSFAMWWECKINCAQCREKYVLVMHGKSGRSGGVVQGGVEGCVYVVAVGDASKGESLPVAGPIFNTRTG